MAYLDIAALSATPLKTEPYDYLVVPDFVRARALFRASSPTIRACPAPARIRLSELDIDGHFKALLDELNGPEFRHAIEDKFGIDLLSRPTMFTVRGECRASDGKIHTNSTTKLDHRAPLHERDNGTRTAGGCASCATAPTSTTMPRKCRRTAARCSSSAARRIPGTAISRSTARGAPSR